MAYSACLHEILKTLKWKHQTQHFRANYIQNGTYGDIKVYSSQGKYALVNAEGEWAVAPRFVVNTIRGWNTEWTRGPFIFSNGFDETDEAAYLISMLQYPTLTEAATRKVNSILTHYADWIRRDIEINDILRRYIKWL